MADNLGYVVAVINQASHQPEYVLSCDIAWDRASAELEAEDGRRETARVGRGERYIVCEVIPVEEDGGDD